MSGFYLMHRGWQEHAVFRNEAFSRRDAFVWLIEEAAYAERQIHTQTGTIALNRGQLSHSLRYMAKAWKWDEARVRRFLASLSKAKIIDASTDARQTVITVCNYEKYQSIDRAPDAPADAPATHRRRGGDAKKNEGNEVIQEKSPTDSSKPDLLADLPHPAALSAADDAGDALSRYCAMRRDLVHGAMPIRVTVNRRTAVSARLREVGGLAGWDAVLAKIRTSAFLRGETSRDGKFVAEIDWLLKPANLTKVMEGNYDDRRPTHGSGQSGGNGQPRPVRTSTVEALRIARAAAGFGRS